MSASGINKSQCTQCSLVSFCSYFEKIGLESSQRHLKRKEILHYPNDPYTKLYAIQHGAIKTYETDTMGNELIRGLYVKDEVYGYEAIYKGHHLFTSIALVETTICEISHQHFLHVLHLDPSLLSRMLYLMSQQLTAASYLKLITAQQRLAAFLIDLQTRLSPGQCHADFLLPMNYQDIGNYLGLATETVSRILSLFRKNNIISIENKRVAVLQLGKLKAIMDGVESVNSP